MGRRRRHKAWLESLGFSTDDWRRIRELAHQVTDTYTPPALTDLSVPIRVAAVKANPRYGSGKLGVITTGNGRKVALCYWRMDDHERGSWAARVRPAQWQTRKRSRS